MIDKLSDDALDLMFREARSYNGYLDRKVSEDDIRGVWELLKWGPTSANMMPARILWIMSTAEKKKLAGVVDPLNVDKVLKAPAVAIIGMDMEFYEKLPKLFPHADIRSWFVGNDPYIESSAFRNSSLQGAYLIMAARAVGLDTGPISGFDNAAVDEAFFKDMPVKSNFICTLGYGDPASIFPRLPRLEFEEACTVL